MMLSTADKFFIFMTFDDWIPLMSQLHGGDEIFMFPWNNLCTANDLVFLPLLIPMKYHIQVYDGKP